MPAQTLANLAYIDVTGYHYADFPTFLAWWTLQYQGIYGTDVYLGPDSQDGQWIAIQAQASFDTAALGASTYNSFSPLTAQGVGLARNVKINGLTKDVPSSSTVFVTVVGVSGTVILNGIAADTLGQQWNLPATTIIPLSGTISVLATAALEGAIFAEIGTITTIFTPTNGWQTVNNSVAAVPGSPVESDAALKIRQSISTAIPASTPLGSTVARVANVSDVTAVLGYENKTSTTQGVTNLPPHSISIVVAGSPDETAVCQAILAGKTPGTDTYGPTPVTKTVFDDQGMPVAISYQPAIGASIQVLVVLTPLVGWTTDFEPLIAAAVANYVNGLPIGGAGNNGTGGFVYLSALYASASLQGQPQASSFVINSIEVGKNGGSQTSTNIAIDWDEKAVCAPGTDVTFSII